MVLKFTIVANIRKIQQHFTSSSKWCGNRQNSSSVDLWRSHEQLRVLELGDRLLGRLGTKAGMRSMAFQGSPVGTKAKLSSCRRSCRAFACYVPPAVFCRWQNDGRWEPSPPQTLGGSFSAVSKPNFASKYALESSRRDLHNALLCTVFESQFFRKTFAKFWKKTAKNSAIFNENFEIRERCKGVHCVDLGKSFPTSIYLQNLASIQPRTSREVLKFELSEFWTWTSKFQSSNLNSGELELTNLFGLVLGCIEAKFCK